MAWYDVTYKCGHTGRVQLVGKTADRERKLEWMAKQECPQCWGLKKREQEAKEPIVMTICCNGLDKDRDGDVIGEVVLTGGTLPRKNEIKALGYFWGEVRGGLMSLLSAKRAEMAWQKNVKLIDVLENQEVIQRLKDDAKQLEAKIVNGLNALDVEMAKKAIAERETQKVQKAAQDRMIARLQQPVMPESYPRRSQSGANWNGKFYGNERRGYEYYINNKKQTLTADEYADCLNYQAAMKVYHQKVKDIREGKVTLEQGASEDAPGRKQQLSVIMKRAWQIVREAALKIGCAIKEVVFGECLKQAWAEARA